jgi:hypothetical protein
MTPDLIVIYEHPEWQKPLFAALERRGLSFAAYDLKRNAFDPARLPSGRLYFNQASPSAYIRGNTRAVPLALSLMRSLEAGGARVLNGSRAFALELSKSAQSALMFQLGIDHPRFLFIGQMIQHIPPLVNLAALDRRRLASVLLHCRRQRLAAIQNVEPRLGKIEPTLQQIAQQLTHHRRVFRCSLPDAQDRFPPVFTDSQRGNHLLSFEGRRIDQ